MNKKKTTFKDVISSKGMEYLNRAHFRSFSRYVFVENANQLLLALNSLTDPAAYAKALGEQQDNFEKTHAVMREVNRLFHNFLAGAMTLVDHTRAFVDETYLGTPLKAEFTNRVNRNFVGNKLTKFVQDLRNYMVHCGTLPLQRHLTMKPIKDERPEAVTTGTGFPVTAETGFQLDVSELRKWKGWKSDAKQFLIEAEEHIELISLVTRYRILINTFHNELDDLLREHHKDDLAYLAKLNAEFEQSEKEKSSQPTR